jgi:hypothetical protein
VIKIIKILIVGFLTSLFFFPIDTPSLPGANTKMILAVIGVILFFLDCADKKSFSISKDFLKISLMAIAVSVWTLFVTTILHTYDDTFSSYFMSFWVWTGGAYTIVRLIRAVHGEITVEIIGNYLIGVCVFQCAMAFGAIYSPLIKQINTASMDPGALNMFKEKSHRLYGFGAAFDPAGLRMAGVLIINAFLFCKAFRDSRLLQIVLYSFTFVFIVAIGNMIARSTIIGAGLAAVLVFLFFLQNRSGQLTPSVLLLSIAMVVVFTCGFVILYKTSPQTQAFFRFGFEGFFSLAETGKWTVHSNEILKKMIVWPEAFQTWVIGDGHLRNPRNDPNFLGPIMGGFYMGTDIGYIRFIFYFGLPGLVMMAGVFVMIAMTCIKHLDKEYTVLFLLLLLSNFVGWLKVMSDIIMVFTPFLILAFQKAEEPGKEELPDNA